jgi:hypothetical protein
MKSVEKIWLWLKSGKNAGNLNGIPSYVLAVARDVDGRTTGAPSQNAKSSLHVWYQWTLSQMRGYCGQVLSVS